MKSTIRDKMLKKRDSLSSAVIVNAEKKLLKKIKNHRYFTDIKYCALYISIENEVPTEKMINFLLKCGVSVVIPRMVKRDLVFHLYNKNHLVTHSFGVVEPDPRCAEVALSDCDLVVLPGVAFDAKGGRLGRGGGYYDRALSQLDTCLKKPRFLGLAYDFQLVDSVFSQKHDVGVDEVIFIETDG